MGSDMRGASVADATTGQGKVARTRSADGLRAAGGPYRVTA